MTQTQWNTFKNFRDTFKIQCTVWNQYAKELVPLQKKAADKDTPPYTIETPIVYNYSLDEITPQSNIKLIIIGDNPGKNEQLTSNQRYLVGQAGKIADGFFRRNPELNIDFHHNVIILNKTPIHTAKTLHLKYLIKNGSPDIVQFLRESQIWMAEKTVQLHKELTDESPSIFPELWLVGYSEIKDKGIFVDYRNSFLSEYKTENTGMHAAWNNVYVYQHFSMNRFSIDLTAFQALHTELNLMQALQQLGIKHKNETFPSRN